MNISFKQITFLIFLLLIAFSIRAQTMLPPCGAEDKIITCFLTIKGSDGSDYSGGMRDGKYEGRGVLRNKELGKYEGIFQAGSASGYGMHQMPNGDKYIGFFKNNDYDGNGKMIFSNGSPTKEGLWEAGILKTPKKIDFDEKLIKDLNIEFDNSKLTAINNLMIKIGNTDVETDNKIASCKLIPNYDLVHAPIQSACNILKQEFANDKTTLTSIYMQEYQMHALLAKKENGSSCGPVKLLSFLVSEVESSSIGTSYYHLSLASCFREKFKFEKSTGNKSLESLSNAIDLYQRALKISNENLILARLGDTFVERKSYDEARKVYELIPSRSSFYKDAQKQIAEIIQVQENIQIEAMEEKEREAQKLAEKKRRDADFNTPICVNYRNAVKNSNKMCAQYFDADNLGRRFIPCQNSAMVSQGYGARGSEIAIRMNKQCTVLEWTSYQ